MASYLEQIDAQLAALHMEMERLQIARDVITKLEGRSKPQVLTLKANPAPSQKSGPITIRKITDGSEGEKPKRQSNKGGARVVDRKRGPEARKKIMAVIKEAAPINAAGIIERLGYDTQRDNQLVYNTTSKWLMDGVLTKDEERRFALADPEIADDRWQ